MGNPTSYRGRTLSWEGKQLSSYSWTIGMTTGTYSYYYDENGLRTQKLGAINGTTVQTTDYYYNGSVLIGMTNGSTYQRFSYDANGRVVSVDYSTDGGSTYTTYYYLRNAQGDVVKLIDGSGNTVVEYTYDSWGKLLSTTGTLAATLGGDQPFRYRGYVYDEETQWYYLQSRYYDPTTCRFISADVYLSTGQGVLGHNSFAYCLNNPAIMTDDEGSVARDLTMLSMDQPDIPTYDYGVRRYEYGEEKQAITAFMSGFTVYYRGVRLNHNYLTESSFTLPENIYLHDNQLDVNTLRHEYGHAVQARILGHKKYIKYIAVFSVAGYIASEANEEYRKYYYSQPWERGADYYGSVAGREEGYLDGSLEAWRILELWIILFG